MRKAIDKLTSTRRRFLTIGALGAATISVPALAAAPSITDPSLVIAAERDRLRAIHTTLENRVHAIAEANPLPMWGQGWPRVDRSLAVFKDVDVEDGQTGIARWDIEHADLPADMREALLKWWDDENAAMDRRGIETGYRQANDELDAMSKRLVDKECELADVQATTIAGALERLRTALDTIITGEPSTYGGDGPGRARGPGAAHDGAVMSALPTLAEVPPVTGDGHRDMEELLRLGLIPVDDAKLRAAAVSGFIADERDNKAPGGAPAGAFTERLKGFSEIGAQTPGGIAWKIATALDFWKDEENWEWWRYLLYSALVDAAELERRRVAENIPGPD